MKVLSGRRSVSRRVWLPLIAGAVVLAGFGPQEAEEQREAAGFLAAEGRLTFRIYCASCHGAEARGDGHLAQFLNVPPSDLTRISERRGGEFPEDDIAEMIDGRSLVKGHGTREMPVWGDVFGDSGASDKGAVEEPEERVDRKIRELVLFLETIQVEPDAGVETETESED